jgi:hypothetical protein
LHDGKLWRWWTLARRVKVMPSGVSSCDCEC